MSYSLESLIFIGKFLKQNMQRESSYWSETYFELYKLSTWNRKLEVISLSSPLKIYFLGTQMRHDEFWWSK